MKTILDAQNTGMELAVHFRTFDDEVHDGERSGVRCAGRGKKELDSTTQERYDVVFHEYLLLCGFEVLAWQPAFSYAVASQRAFSDSPGLREKWRIDELLSLHWPVRGDPQEN